MKIKNFLEAQSYLSSHIPKNPATLFPGGLGLERTKFLLKLLDNPQDKLKVIHIAGTSGKSSTSYLISLLLTCIGKKSGLFISPHIGDIRERIRINNILISQSQFIRYLNEIIPFIKKIENSGYGMPTNFEILTALAFYFFWKEKAEYAIMETGIGGLQDATNVIEGTNKICIITKIGMDHTDILGKTLSEIATQKVGIITKNSIVITPEQKDKAINIIKNSAKINKAKLYIVKDGFNYKFMSRNIRHSERGTSRGIPREITPLPRLAGSVGMTMSKTVFTFDFLNIHLKHLSLGVLGKYQVENCSLALSALILVSNRDGFVINENRIRETLASSNFFGRLSQYKINGKSLIIDGAHNGQKMEAFIQAIKHLYPGRQFHFLIAFKKGKDFTKMLHSIIPLAESITVTSFKITQDWLSESIKPNEVTKVLSKLGFNKYRVITNNKSALERLLALKNNTDIIVTGSFYLISELFLSLRERSKASSPAWQACVATK